MAQIDTGLGWSANDGYLIQSGNIKLCAMGGLSWDYPEFAGRSLPVTGSSAAEVVAQGSLFATVADSTNTPTWELYIGASEENMLCAIEVSGNAQKYVAYSTANTGSVYVVSKKISDSALSRTVMTVNQQHWRMPGVFYGYSQGSGSYQWGSSATSIYWIIPVIPWQGNSLDDFMFLAYSHLVVGGIDVYKKNAGYAVACAVIYNSTDGRTATPVLISTDPGFAEYDYSGSLTEYVDTFLLDGVRFYLRIITGQGTISDVTVPSIDLSSGPIVTPYDLFRGIAGPSYANILILDSPDPYNDEGGETGEEGGDGEEPDDDENGIEVNRDFPSAINTGFCRIYCPSETELRNLSNYLWSNNYDLTQVKKLFSNPMDSVIGLSAVPLRLSGASVNFTLGGVAVPDMTLPMVSQQRYTVYMGGITVKERWGSYLDYDPYTKFSIFLPFIGMRELSTDDIMGKQVMLYYDIDILSGICTARLQAGKHCVYEWGGSCALQLPINSRNWDSVFNTAVGAVSGIVSAASGGAAPLVTGSVASAALQTVSMKPRIDKSGTVSGASGWLGQMTPYLIRSTPEAYIAGNQNKYIGYPSFMSISLGTLTGYNEIESVHLENIPATGDELSELESILKGGVIF